MNERQFIPILQQLKKLSPSQRQRLHQNLAHTEISAENILTVQVALHQCPHCASSLMKPWGSSHGLPRYRCKSCNKTSNPLTNTPLPDYVNVINGWFMPKHSLMD